MSKIAADDFALRKVGGGSFSWSCAGSEGSGGILNVGRLCELDDLDAGRGSCAAGVGCVRSNNSGFDEGRSEDGSTSINRGDRHWGDQCVGLTCRGLSCRASRSSGKSDISGSGARRPTSISGVVTRGRSSISSSSLWRRTMPLLTGLFINAPPRRRIRIVL